MTIKIMKKDEDSNTTSFFYIKLKKIFLLEYSCFTILC